MTQRNETPAYAASARPESFNLGELAQRYQLGRALGKGASASVYAARDLLLERDVVLKMPHHCEHARPEGRERFRNEARILASLAHPNVVMLHDFVESRERLVLVMEVAAGGTLEDLIAHGPLSPEQAMRMLLPVMGALACAHDRGVLHRDVKPANIALVMGARGALETKLLDFGIARLHGARRMTPPGVIMGTPEYMAPEQIACSDLGPQTDVWAMGVLLYRCLSGSPPFRGENTGDILRRILAAPAPRLGEQARDGTAVGTALAQAIDRALQRNRQMRYASMREFARALAQACVQDEIEVPRDPDPIGLPDFSTWLTLADRRHTLPLVVPPSTRQPIPAAQAGPRCSPIGRLSLALSVASVLVGFLLWHGLGSRGPAKTRALSSPELTDMPAERAPFAHGFPAFSLIPAGAEAEPSLESPVPATLRRAPVATFKPALSVEAETPVAAVELEDPPTRDEILNPYEEPQDIEFLFDPWGDARRR